VGEARSVGDTMSMETLNEISTTEEAARFLRLKRQTLEMWRLKGTGPTYLKLGRRVVYRREALERFMAVSERRSTSDPGLKG
jgi:predicted site-specific integrase-resolvase